jgi:hypothetical protein
MRNALFIALFVLSLVVCAYAADPPDNIQISESPEDTFWVGAFAKPFSFSPGDSLTYWAYFNSQKPGYPYHFVKKYKFLGRTGDKTFEVEYTSETETTKTMFSKGGKEVVTTKMNMFLDSSELFHLKNLDPLLTFNGFPCSAGDKVYLKMIGLKGNSLEAQIIIPDCLKKLLKEK